MRQNERKVFVAGATGYLGGFLTAEFARRGHHVDALSRSQSGADRVATTGVTPVIAEATQEETLDGLFDHIDVVVSSLGITRQKDGLSYEDVDYKANLNLLRAAEAAGVELFVYVSVFNGEELTHTAMVSAKERFVEALKESKIRSLIVRPTGFFSDMEAFFEMAGKGRVWVFGGGHQAFNPIDGADLAEVIADAVDAPVGTASELAVGGPEELTMRQIGEAAFAAQDREPRISSVPMWLVAMVERVLPRVTPQSVYGPVQFFLAVSHVPMVAPAHGTRRLSDHYAHLASQGDDD